MSNLSPIKQRLHDLSGSLTEESRRLFHGRGGAYENLNFVSIDWFFPAVVVTLFECQKDSWVSDLVTIIHEGVPNVKAIYIQQRTMPNPVFDLEWGEDIEGLVAQRKGLKFKLNLCQQNIGYFLDIEPAREWLEPRCRGKNVLNLFAFTCSFSVIASSSGASGVLNMDLSSKSLEVGRASYQLSGVPTVNTRFYANDILKSWGRLKRFGPYDVVIVDPPSFQKGSFVATKDYQKVLRRLDSLVTKEGEVLLCLNAPETSYSEFLTLIQTSIPSFTFVKRLEAHPDFPDTNSEKSLKLLVFKK